MPKLYIGLDIHKKSWSVHLATDICDHRSFTMSPQPEKLEQYVFDNFAEYQVEIAYESGCCGFSAARYFLQLGWQVTVVNAADIPRIQKQQFQKTDRIDCRLLCRHLKQQDLRKVLDCKYPASAETRRSRARLYQTKTARLPTVRDAGR